ATAGLLDNKKATSFPGTLDDMVIPGMQYQTTAVVVDGNVVTSRGPGTAMDFALMLIELLVSAARRKMVEEALQRPN
ncbi:MAG TPA: DJ-1 family protein, partial [Gammaproteobacteria bacterium]|nr:DJ-1 family protein [Gammaproteobacteria bacterium]